MSKFEDITRRDGSQSSPEDTRGFALPTVLVLMMVLSTLTVFLLSSSSDAQRAGRAIRESARSFYAADAGVNAVIADWASLSYDTLAPNPGDSADLGWTTLDNGARYRAVLVRVDGGATPDALYSVRVVGQGAGELGGSTTMFREMAPAAGGAIFEYDGAAISGGAGGGRLDVDADGFGGAMVDGRDTIPAAWADEGVCGPLQDGPGTVWKDTTKVDYDPGNVVGDPNLVQDVNMTAPQLLDFGGVTYDDLVAMADITYTDDDLRDGIGPVLSGGSCNTSVETNWGDPLNPSSPCFDYFPIVHFTGDVRMRDEGGNGQGILLFDDEIEIEDMDFDFNFWGLMIQKGPGVEGMELEESGVNLYGAMIAGGDVDIEDGATIRYSSCAVERALNSHGLSTGGSGSMSERVWRQATN